MSDRIAELERENATLRAELAARASKHAWVSRKINGLTAHHCYGCNYFYDGSRPPDSICPGGR